MFKAVRKIVNLRPASRSMSSFASTDVPVETKKTSLMFTVSDAPGALQNALNVFSAHKVNLSRLESKPCQNSTDYEFHVAFDGETTSPKIQQLLESLRQQTSQVNVTAGARVPWFPRTRKDLDIVANEILDAGAELESDHPGFHDPAYRASRALRTKVAYDHRYGQPIPKIEYTPEETECWLTIYKTLRPLHDAHSCAEHKRLLPMFEQNCAYDKRVPQLQEVSEFLSSCTGFTLRPVAGLLSARTFLYGLAMRTFFSTPYLRHHSRPLYTPEPDIVHELMGHVPLFADQDFADFSQQIGLAAIGATDAQIEQLARCYWFTVEFGLCKQKDELKAYGAGLLSSPGELQYSMLLNDEKPQLKPFDPFVAAQQDYPITTYQPLYFVAESFADAKEKMIEFTKSLSKPFNARYNPYTQRIEVDANVECQEHVFMKPSNPYAQQ